jgi:RimJ/RimL family protein N-acetyltransferase
MTPPLRVVLMPMTADAGEALRAARSPEGLRVADDYPTEFSAGVGATAGRAGPLGPFFIQRAEDDVIVGEIGGGTVAEGTVELGYAVVKSCWGRGYASEAVGELVRRARAVPGVRVLIGHTPFDRPSSARVLEKNGFRVAGEEEDEHDGVRMRVQRWELVL